MVAAGRLGPAGGLRPHTYRALIGLLAGCGLRISKALNLADRDVDLDGAALTVEPLGQLADGVVPRHAEVVGLPSHVRR